MLNPRLKIDYDRNYEIWDQTTSDPIQRPSSCWVTRLQSIFTCAWMALCNPSAIVSRICQLLVTCLVEALYTSSKERLALLTLVYFRTSQNFFNPVGITVLLELTSCWMNDQDSPQLVDPNPRPTGIFILEGLQRHFTKGCILIQLTFSHIWLSPLLATNSIRPSG